MYCIITASPNRNGLTAACGQAAKDGITSAGGSAELFDLCAESKLEACRVCADGWGSCRKTAKCVIGDGFAELQTALRKSEGLILVTPVYFGGPSERMEAFLRRFRRCEAFNPDGSALKGKQVDLVAAAGGSGNAAVPCLTELELWCRHVAAIPKDRIGITRFNRTQMLPAIADAAARLVRGEYFKES